MQEMFLAFVKVLLMSGWKRGRKKGDGIVVTHIYFLINKALLFFSPFFYINLLCPAVHV